jgi:hypothetical protein
MFILFIAILQNIENIANVRLLIANVVNNNFLNFFGCFIDLRIVNKVLNIH